MKVTIFGTGYVGLVTGACLAEMGNHVVCVDVDQAKVDGLRNGVIPIFEPGLKNLIQDSFSVYSRPSSPEGRWLKSPRGRAEFGDDGEEHLF